MIIILHIIIIHNFMQIINKYSNLISFEIIFKNNL